MLVVVRILESKEIKLGRLNMQLTRISPKHQITIPKEVFEKLQLEVGDFLEVEATEAGVLLVPKKLISKDQAWFWSKDWQQKEMEADQAIERGDLSKPFQKTEDLLKHLKQRR
jgi:antitoxin MazE